MVAEKTMHLAKYKDAFAKHFGSVDELGQVILKGHLIIESVLDNIIGLIVFHPEHIQDAQLGFRRKVQLARALALRKDKYPIWNLVLSINAVRNEVAHNLLGEKRRKKVEQLRRLYLTEADPERRDEHEKEPDHIIAMFACALCTGFLGTLEDDLKGLRGLIDGMDAVLNSDKDRVLSKHAQTGPQKA